MSNTEALRLLTLRHGGEPADQPRTNPGEGSAVAAELFPLRRCCVNQWPWTGPDPSEPAMYVVVVWGEGGRRVRGTRGRLAQVPLPGRTMWVDAD